MLLSVVELRANEWNSPQHGSKQPNPYLNMEIPSVLPPRVGLVNSDTTKLGLSVAWVIHPEPKLLLVFTKQQLCYGHLIHCIETKCWN